MPVKGRKPKPEGQKRNRNQPTHEWTEVPDVPFKGKIPALPKRLRAWPTRTKQKWKAWSSMPHCVLWSSADWDFALDSLEIAAQFHEGDVKVATELRNRERVLGTTVDFRRDLRIRYVDSKTQEQPTEDVTNLNDYRDRVG